MRREARSGAASSSVACHLVLAEKKLKKLSELFAMCPEEQESDMRFTSTSGSNGDGDGGTGRSTSGTEFVVVHKAAYDLVLRDAGDAAAAARWELLQRVPPSALLEPIERAVRFADRAEVCRCLAQLSPAVHQPRFAELRGTRADVLSAASTLTFPLLCKPFVACGPAGHKLILVLRPAGLSQLCEGAGASAVLTQPLLAQEYVDHGGIVIKGYTVGEYTHLVAKPSLPDLASWCAGGIQGDSSEGGGGEGGGGCEGRREEEAEEVRSGPAVVHLDSQQLPMSCAAVVSVLGASGTQASDGEAVGGGVTTGIAECAGSGSGGSGGSGGSDEQCAELVEHYRAAAEAILSAVRAHMGVQLLGVDMVAAPDGSLQVVDANHFSGAPSSVPGFADALAQAVRRHRARQA